MTVTRARKRPGTITHGNIDSRRRIIVGLHFIAGVDISEINLALNGSLVAY
jgi:hypothetical protein